MRLLKLAILINCILGATQIHGKEDAEADAHKTKLDGIYTTALDYRDGKNGKTQDLGQAKQLFEQVIEEDPNNAKAHHNLGLIAYKSKFYEEARARFQTASGLGLKESEKNIWRMIIDKKIEASDEERFLAICDLNEYPLPMSREAFSFNYKLGEFSNTTRAKFGGAIHAQQFINSGYISSPIIWVEDPAHFMNVGTIQTRLLVVGTKRVKQF